MRRVCKDFSENTTVAVINSLIRSEDHMNTELYLDSADP